MSNPISDNKQSLTSISLPDKGLICFKGIIKENTVNIIFEMEIKLPFVLKGIYQRKKNPIISILGGKYSEKKTQSNLMFSILLAGLLSNHTKVSCVLQFSDLHIYSHIIFTFFFYFYVLKINKTEWALNGFLEPNETGVEGKRPKCPLFIRKHDGWVNKRLIINLFWTSFRL